MVVRQLIALPSQLQLIDRLQHHIYLSSSLIFLSSQQGAGKSTLLEQLTNKLSRETKEAFITLNDQQPDPQIRQKILVQLYENPLFDAQDSLFSSMSLLQEKQSVNGPLLIVIDNAQYLTEQLLGELAELIAQKMLFGDNEINALLLADGPHSRKMFTAVNQLCGCLEFKLEPLSQDESQHLLNYIFKQSDYQHKIQHQDAVSKQLTACQGNPSKIILLGEKIIAGELTNNELSWLKTRLPAILMMLLLLAIAGGLGSYLYSIFIQPVNTIKEMEEVVKVDDAQSTAIIPQQALSSAQTSEPEVLAGNWEAHSIKNIESNKLQVGIDDPVAAEESSKLVVPSEPVEENIPQEKIVVEEATEPVSIEKKEVLETPQPIVKVVAQKEPVAETKKESIFTEKSELLAISPLHYTLQLSALTTKASLQRFLLKYDQATNNLRIYQTTYNNKPRYVVIFGEYNSWGAARKASQSLPGSLANLDTWIKKYQLVHQDLQANNEEK